MNKAAQDLVDVKWIAVSIILYSFGQYCNIIF